MNIVDAEVELSLKGLLLAVSGLVMYRDVNRTSLIRWRKQLNMPDPPYTIIHAQAIAYYADRLALGVRPVVAIEQTKEYIRNYEQQ